MREGARSATEAGTGDMQVSAYVVDDITINRILAGIKVVQAARNSCAYYPFEQAGYDIRSSDGLKRLGSAMFNLNVRSVRGRYEDDGPIGGLPGTVGHGEFTYQALRVDYEQTLVQALASLGCWTYQSCEAGCNADPLYSLIDHDARIEILEALVKRYAPEPEEAWA